MLYVSTRNTTDTFTAYRALHEERAPDGGFYVPFRLPHFSEEMLQSLKGQSFSDAVAQVLNLFFGLRLRGWDVACAIGRDAVRIENTNQRLAVAECWHNPDGTFTYLVRQLYNLAAGKDSVPSGWFCIAAEIALLFGLYASMADTPEKGFDIAVAAGNFEDIAAARFAKDMGLPINTLICTCNENSAAWDFVNKGEWNTNLPLIKTGLPALDIVNPAYVEYFIFANLGVLEVSRYLDTCQRKGIYRIDDEQLEIVNTNLYMSVVSAKRVDTIIAGMFSSIQYRIDSYTALAYGGLQDYRSSVGLNFDTIVLAKERPGRAKE